MNNTLRCALLTTLVVAACSTGKQINSKPVAANPLIQPLGVFLNAMNTQNCESTADELRTYLQSLNLNKYQMDRDLQQYLFQMRLSVKNIYAEGVQADSAKNCMVSAKRVLSDLRTLEETLGFQMQNPGKRSPAASTVAQPSIFTDSHRQLVSNSQRDDGVSSLMDLKTADILLLHRSGTQPLLEQSGSDWTDVVVVFRDAEGELYLFFVEDTKVRRRGWWQSNDWIKRNVSRMQVLRPLNAMSADVVERLQNRTLKNSYAFGNLIKKEFKLKTSSTELVGVGEVVLGVDLEMSPDLVAISEWKDYSAAYTSRVLSQMPVVPPRSVLPQFFYNHESPIYQGQKKTQFDERIMRGVTSH